MNPPQVMKLVEVVKGLRTSEETLSSVKEVAEKMGKEPVVVNDSPGFISNRVLMPMINEAIYGLMEGIAPKESVDKIMKLLEIETLSVCFTSEDHIEGMKAFFEKRKPEFKGR